MRLRVLLAVLGCAAASFVTAPCAAAADTFDLQAHRGGRGETTEESLRAFAKALELGVSTLELDIVITKDHQPLVWHDPKIDPTKCSDTRPAVAGDPQYPYVGKLVHDLTLAQLRTLDCGKLLAGFPTAEVVRGNRIATLPEVFSLADTYHAGVRYNVETKVEAAAPEASAPPREFVDVILAAVRAAGKVGEVEIQSFDWRTLPMVREAEPSIPLVALWDETTYVPDSPWLGGVNPADVPDPIEGAQLVGANILSPGYSVPPDRTPRDPDFHLVADRSFVDRAHAAGLTVIPWTIDDPAAMNAQIDAGADGIITDYPSRLRAVLAARGMPLPPAFHR
ncbi:glycerophosphodiester phosphodiesterase [Mycolicibacterium madagascariense]|nr:glycerophosphodiester phosphodiesterase family protein [Mycolicibacterium madagascariense]MCV7010801.1 glycerophosphodiester phosphodiesterase [Mycolicibacterium madagascariense]